MWVVKYAINPLCNFPISKSSESDVCSTCYWRFGIGFEGVYMPSMLSGSHSKAIGFFTFSRFWDHAMLLFNIFWIYYYSYSYSYYYIFLYICRWSCCTPLKMYKDSFHLKLRWKCWRKLVIVETHIRAIWKAQFKLCSKFYILLVLLSKLKFKKASRITCKGSTPRLRSPDLQNARDLKFSSEVYPNKRLRLPKFQDGQVHILQNILQFIP